MNLIAFLKKYTYIVIVVLSLFMPMSTHAANLYFSGSGMGGDGDWANIMNWYTDSGFTSQSMSLPTSADAVFIHTPVNANYSMSPAEAYSAEFRSMASLGISLTVTTNASFYESTSITGMVGSLTGTAKFYDSSMHQGVVIGNGEFYDTSINAGNFMGNFCMGPSATNMSMGTPTGVCSTGLYFSGSGMGGDGDWSNSSNWWADAGFTVPAAVPDGMSTEHVTVSSSVTSNSGMSAFAHSVTFVGIVSLDISLTAQNGAVFEDSSINNGTITGDAIFKDTSANSGVITGTACFYPSTTNNGTAGTVTACRDIKYFNGAINDDWSTLGNWWNDAGFSVHSAGFPTGQDEIVVSANINNKSNMMDSTTIYKATFSGSANLGIGITVDDVSVFNNTSAINMGGSVTGLAEFNDSASTLGGSTVYGTSSFYDTSTNTGTVNGNACFDTTATNSGTVTGTVSVCGYIAPRTLYFRGHVDHNWNTLANWYTDAGFSTPAASLPASIDSVVSSVSIELNTGGAASVQTLTLNGTSTLGISVTVASSTIFNDMSYNNGGTITGSARFNTGYYNNGVTATSTVMTFANTVWNGTVTGTTTGANGDVIQLYVFNGTSTSVSAIKGDVIYNDTSYNNGSNIIGNARLNTTYYGNGIAATSSTLTLVNTIWNGTISAVTSGSTDVPILLYEFNGTSTNNSTITGEAHFNDTSVNNGVITGDACIGIFATNNGTVNGTASVCLYTDALTLYYGGMTAGDWNDTFSWKIDNGFAISSPQIPNSIDTIIVSSPITSNTGAFPTVLHATINSGGVVSTPFSATGLVTFNTGSYASSTTITGNVVFKNGSESINTTVIGNACFEAGSINSSTTVIGGNLTVCDVPPTASSVVVTPTVSTAVVTWNTDVQASTSVRYGLTSFYDLISTSTATTSHQLTLTGLSPSTTYHYQILSVDVWGNSSVSTDATFTTSATPVNQTVPAISTGWSGPTGGSSGGSVSSYATPTVITVTTTPPATASNSTTYTFTRSLSSNTTHSEVKTLQQFLNAHGFTVAKKGAGSVGKEITKFGPATRAALIRFQKAYKITPAVGFFGPITRGVVAGMK